MSAVAKLPSSAVVKAARMVPYEEFEKLTSKAKLLIKDHHLVRDALLPKNAAHVVRAFNNLECSGTGIARSADRVEQLDDAISKFGDAAFDDDTGAVARPVVTQRLARLLGSFPVSNIPNPDAFAGAMLEEVMVAAPSLMALEGACWKLIRTSKFVPSIKEVLDSIAEAKKFWDDAYEAIMCLGEDLEELKALCSKTSGAQR